MTKNTRNILTLMGIYFSVRIFSYFFSPTSPLYSANPINYTLGIVIAVFAGYLLIRRNVYGWHLIAGEIILGGSGNYVEVFGIALRTVLLVIALSTFFVQNGKSILYNKNDLFLLFGMLTIAGLGAVNGIISGNSPSLVVADTIPYFFLLYYFPLRELLNNDRWKNFAISSLKSALIAQALFILITFFAFAQSFFVLQDAFYHWYRDIANGKITLVEFDFHRLVLNEQLLLAPILLYFLYRLIYQRARDSFPYIAVILFLLSINLTRIYFVAIVIGGLLLFSLSVWRQWFKVMTGCLAAFILIFCSLSLFASSGKTLGLEMFGLRIQSIVTPNIEDSSLSRLMLLPKILDSIKLTPLLGTGLGSTISVYSPIFNRPIITSHFDWGYLEIMAELGLLGLIIWLSFIYKIFTKIKKLPNWQFVSFIALLVINITSPGLFHVLGFIWLTLLFSQTNCASSELSPLPKNNH